MQGINRPLYCQRCGTSEVKDCICSRCGCSIVATKPPAQLVLTRDDRLFLKSLRITAE
jgi:hypothetical protein